MLKVACCGYNNTHRQVLWQTLSATVAQYVCRALKWANGKIDITKETADNERATDGSTDHDRNALFDQKT